MPTLRELREKHYISRKVLARAAGVSESTIIRMEEGKTHTTKEAADKVLGGLSNITGEQFTTDNIEGLNLYNPMRDRAYPTKYKIEPSAA